MVWIPMISFSQQKEILRYFISKDSLVGVKNQKGKIIIPAEFKDYTGIKEGESVPEGIGNETILFAGGKRNDRFEKIPLDTCMIEKVIFYTSLIYLITEQTTSQKGSEGL